MRLFNLSMMFFAASCAAPMTMPDPAPAGGDGGPSPMGQDGEAKLAFSPGLTSSFDPMAGVLTIDGYDFTIRFEKGAGWRPVSYQMKNVPDARGCPGAELSGTPALVDPIRFPCPTIASGKCSYDATGNTGIDDPIVDAHPSSVSFYVALHGSNAFTATTTYTVYASGRLVVESELVPGPQTYWPTTIESGHVAVSAAFQSAQPIPAQAAFAFTGTCEVLGLGASVGAGSLVMVGDTEAWLRELKPMGQPPLVRAMHLDVAPHDYDPTARAVASRNAQVAVYQGGTLEGDGLDVKHGSVALGAGGGDLLLRTAGGSPAIRIDGWGMRPFSIRKNGVVLATQGSPFTKDATADVDSAGTLRISLRGDYLATDDIKVGAP